MQTLVVLVIGAALVATVVFAMNAIQIGHWRSGGAADQSSKTLPGAALQTTNTIAAIVCAIFVAVLGGVMYFSFKAQQSIAPTSVQDVITNNPAATPSPSV